MPGLFAMKRESWARLVRVSSLPRYAPSRRIAKGLSLSLVFLFGPRREQHRSRPTPETSDLSISNPALPPSRTSCVAHYQRMEQKATLSARRVLFRSGVEWRGEGRRIHTRILVTLIPCPCTERPSGRPPTRRISRFTQGRISFFINAGILGTYLSLKGCVTFGGSELSLAFS